MNWLIIVFSAALASFAVDIFKTQLYNDFEEEINKSNKLYKCDSCNKLFRLYQVDLIKAKTEKEKCPHCEKKIVDTLHSQLSIIFDKEAGLKSRDTQTTTTDIRTEDSWMSTHPDCPKITNKKHYKAVKRLIETIKKDKENQEEFNRFMEYNKIKVESNWINKINKTEGGE